ncbi:MAG: XRE family transcriptional regulator [Candidatus Hydrogenedentes bacterium]|nr:XRE family transcriptional regulator [Candidatus Hydrogenedentota bacterium]
MDERAITEGSGNVFADFGIQKSEEAQLKSRPALRIYKAIQDQGLTQRQAAATTRVVR